MFDNLAGRIEELLTTPPVVVIISGFGGSGKTTLADQVLERFPDSIDVRLDNFLIDRGRGDGVVGGYDWSRFLQVLRGIKKGERFHYQCYDWEKDGLTDWYIDEPVRSLVVVEGVRLLQPDVIALADLTIWIDCPVETGAARGIERDRRNKEWSDQELRLHIQKWHDVWVPKDKMFAETFRPESAADIVYRTAM